MKITKAQALVLNALNAGGTLVFHGNLNRGYVRDAQQATVCDVTRSAWRILWDAKLITERDTNGADSSTGYYTISAKGRAALAWKA